MNIAVTGGTNYVDWTAIIVGLSTGGIQVYSENGSFLYEKQLHTEAILNIRFVSDEITIFYPSCIIVLQTAHLIPLLKSLREMYSKAKTTKIDLMDKDYMLTYKKWDYKKSDILVSDALMIPQQKTCLYDHLLSESLELGFTKKYRLVPSQNASVVSTGAKPFLSFHSAREGFKQNVFTDVAKAVVNRITSRLPGWLTGSQPQTSTERNEEVENSELLYPRHEIIDYQRTGCNIYSAPMNYQLIAVTDSLGRIVLVDTATGVLLRMWKGYRDAQCGFMEVVESRNRKEQSSISRRTGLFLIIYAPRKAILEIWCMQKGPKVATFQASKNGFLIYNSHGMSQQRSSRSNKLPCLFFFDADDNSIKNFSIPFHCILSETNSKSAEDFHYLKKLKMTLKNVNLHDPSAVSSIIEMCEKFQTPEIKLKCLDLLTTYRKTEPGIIKSTIEMFLKSATVVEEKAEDDEDQESAIQDAIYREQLTASCLNYKSLIECYLMAKDISEDDSITSESIELLDSEFLTIQRIVELMSFGKNKESNPKVKNVSFQENEEPVVAFLTSFVVNGETILLNTEHNHHVFESIGAVLFSNAWRGQISMSKLLDVFGVSRIQSEDIMKCFLHFWLQQEVDFSDEETTMKDMTKFKNILDQVFLSAGDKVTYAYNSICLFWQEVREYLLESNNPINSLLAAIACKNYALKKQSESQDFGFEEVTQEECQWTLLTEKLNDVAVLSIFVSQFGASDRKYEAPSISLKKILNDGKGVISEVVASWLIGVNLPVSLIFKSSADEDLTTDERHVVKKLEILRQHFPYSLNASVILCYVIWDLLSGRWSKNLSEMQYLKKGVELLSLFEISDYHLKQGLCVMLWNANFKIPLKATQKLINKTGRLPKEKLCLQNTMIPDFLIPQFLEQTWIFIDHFRGSLNFAKLQFKCEEILQQGSASSLSLCEHILQQPRGNPSLLNLHFEMVLVLELIAFLNIKYTKPMLSLFDEVSNDAFFTDIHKQLTYALQKADEIRQNTRIYFLKKAISTTIDLIVECQQSIYFDDHMKWVEKIVNVGNVWELDESILKRHQIVELYVYGFDGLAEELLEKVSFRDKIVKSLLDVAGKRLDLHLQADKTGWRHVASGGSLVTNFLETIHGRKDDGLLENVKPSHIEKIYRLVYKIFQIASLKNFSDTRALR